MAKYEVSLNGKSYDIDADSPEAAAQKAAQIASGMAQQHPDLDVTGVSRQQPQPADLPGPVPGTYIRPDPRTLGPAIGNGTKSLKIPTLNGARLVNPEDVGLNRQAFADAQKRLGSTPDQARALSQGVSMGWADELDAKGAGLETFLSRLGGFRGYTPEEAEAAVLQANRQADDLFMQEHPGQAIGGRMLGGAALPGLGAGSTAMGTAVRTGVAGGAYGAVAGAGDANGGDRLDGALNGAAMGAGVGTVLGAGGGALGARGARTKANPPRLKPQQQLAREGVLLTPGQATGGIVKSAEDAFSSVPILGSQIKKAQGRSMETFNRAVGNRVLEPLGDQVPDKVPAGREMIEHLETRIGQAYEQALDGVVVDADQPFVTNVKGIADDILFPDEHEAFAKLAKNALEPMAQGPVDGATFKAIDARLGKVVAASGNRPTFREAVMGLQTELRDLAARSNPEKAPEIEAANKAWGMFKRVQRAATGANADEPGVFSPPQLVGALKALDRSSGKGAYARGSAPLQDIAEAGNKVLPQKIPNSGTADRALWAGLGVGGLVNPKIALGGAVATVPYLKPSQQLITMLTAAAAPGASRGQVDRALAEAAKVAAQNPEAAAQIQQAISALGLAQPRRKAPPPRRLANKPPERRPAG
jgi:hypothetical protein